MVAHSFAGLVYLIYAFVSCMVNWSFGWLVGWFGLLVGCVGWFIGLLVVLPVG